MGIIYAGRRCSVVRSMVSTPLSLAVLVLFVPLLAFFATVLLISLVGAS